MAIIDEKLKRMPYTVRVGNIPGGLSEFITIQAAIDYANSQTPTAANPWVIEVYPGTYTGALILYQYISLIAIGNHEDTHLFVSDDTLITLNGAGYQTIKGFTLTVDSPSVATQALINNDTGADWVWIEDCKFRVTNPGAIRMRGYSATVAASNASFKNCFVDVDMLITWIYLDQVGSGVEIDSCISVGAYQDIQCTAGSVWLANSTLRGSGTHLYVDGGDVIFTNTRLNNIIQTAGTILCKGVPQEYHVYAGMRIQDAITAAITATPNPADTAPYTILIHPGIYDEAITCSSWVNLEGVGPKGSVIIYQLNADIITLADNVEIDNLTVRLGTPDAERHLIEDNAVACTARLTNLVMEITAPTNIANLMVFYFTGAGDYIIERCSFNITYTGDAVAHGVHTSTNAATLHLIDNDFTYLANTAAIHVFCSVGSTITGSGNRWAGTAIMFSLTAGTLTFDNDAMICTAGWANTGSTMALRHCAIEAPVVAGNTALVRMKDCSYRAIQRAGTGNIVDESPQLQDAPWKVHRWDWMTALANMDVGVRGNPEDAGSGQVLLEVNTGGADFEAVEVNPEVAGSLGNEFTPARTPRFITQIVVDNFHADARMFFGLRETLNDYIPDITGAGEQCAGFDWDGTTFRAISTNGAGAGIFTNLTLPSTDVQHQLEVIIFGGVQVEFYVDGVLVATHNTAAGIPTAVLDWQHLLESPGVGAPADIDVTVRNGGCQECPV